MAENEKLKKHNHLLNEGICMKMDKIKNIKAYADIKKKST